MIDELDYLYLESKFDEEYKQIIKFIIDNNEFKKRKLYHHHEQRSVYTHSLKVSFYSYKIAKKLKMDYYSTAIGGLLHDFYYNDWQLTKRKGIKNMHGFVHAKEAYDNTIINFEFLKENKKIKDIIIKHMFPLNIKPPFYLESWIVTIVDKCVSIEIFKNSKGLLKYIGIKGR